MSLIFSLLLAFFLPSVYSYACALSQELDTHRICQIFRNTNIDALSLGINFNDNDYCDYNSSYIGCSNTRISAVTMERIHLEGTLDLDTGWPHNLAMIDMKQFRNETALSGHWDWSSVQNLSQLIKIDLEYNKFNNTLSNADWNIIAALPSLTDLVLAGNDFESNFSQIAISNVSGIKYLELSDNNFYGTMDVGTTGFISKFPQLISFRMHSTNIAAHFENLNIFSSAYVPNLHEIDLESNAFSGQLSMSNGYEFAAGFRFFEIDYNAFYGEVDWDIFSYLYGLEALDMNDNAFSGHIDWQIIADLATNGVLYKLHLKNNNFTGYADFSWIPAAGIELSLDADIHCDPVIYPCIGSVQMERSQIHCYSKSECEASCQCTPTNHTNNATAAPTLRASSGIFTAVLGMDSFSFILIGIVFGLLCIICGCAVFVIFLIHYHYKRRHKEIKKHRSNSDAQHEGEDTHTIPVEATAVAADQFEGGQFLQTLTLKGFPSGSLPQIPDSMPSKAQGPGPLLDVSSATDMESMYGSVPRVTSGFAKSPPHSNNLNGNYESGGLPKPDDLNEDHEYEYYYEDECQVDAEEPEYEYYYVDEEVSVAEMIYLQYFQKFGYPPKEAGHLLRFAKEKNESMTWKEASNTVKNPPSTNVDESASQQNSAYRE